MTNFQKIIKVGFSHIELLNIKFINDSPELKNRITFGKADHVLAKMYNTNYTTSPIVELGDDKSLPPSLWEITFHDEVTYAEFMLLL